MTTMTTRGSVGHRSDRTPGQTWRRRRNLVIALAWHAGASQALLAEAFDLSRKRVQEILAELPDGQAEASAPARDQCRIR